MTDVAPGALVYPANNEAAAPWVMAGVAYPLSTGLASVIEKNIPTRLPVPDGGPKRQLPIVV